MDPTIRKDYISSDTWDKIKERNEEQEKGDPEKKVIALNKEIKKMAFNNRKNQKLEEFNENPEDKNKKHLWKAVKNLKGKFTPKYIQMRNKEGRLVPLNKRAEAIADYLEKEHWYNPPEPGVDRTISRRKLQLLENKAEQERPFEMKELLHCIGLTKKEQRTRTRQRKDGTNHMAG